MYYVIEFKNKRIGFHRDATISFRHVLKYQYAYHWGARSWKKVLSIANPVLVQRLFRPLDLQTFLGDGVANIEAVLNEVFGLNRDSSHNIFLLFPPQKSRCRLFAFWLDEGGVCKSFLKVGWSTDDSARILAEVDVIQNWKITRGLSKSFLIPSIVRAHKVTEHIAYAQYDPIPSSLPPGPSNWNSLYERVWNELRESTEQHLSIEQAIRILEQRGCDAFWHRVLQSVVARDLGTKFTFCSSHGDFAPWNVRLSPEGPYVIDWEHYAEMRPMLCDPIYFFVRVEQLLRKRDSIRIASKLPMFLGQVHPSGNKAADILFSLCSLSQARSERSPDIFREVAEAYWKLQGKRC